ALGAEVLKSLSPGQQMVKIVHEELIALLGGSTASLKLEGSPPVAVLVMGLQGSGKTTFSAKLALHLKSMGRRPLLVACDLQRPAAIEQLETLAGQCEVAVYTNKETKDVVQVAQEAQRHALQELCDVLVVDTAGRLQIDEALMVQLAALSKALQPSERLLVLDAMTGQEAVSIARTFDEKIGVTGSVLTKLDGDARGGAALSMVEVTGKPIKFVSTGEKPNELDVFHPDRIAGRILGMGDMLSLIEKAQQEIDEEKAKRMEQKLRKQQFDLEDFLDQLRQIKKMGPLKQVLGLMPGMNAKMLKEAKVDEKQMARTEAIISSMTLKERRRPEIINGSRRKRIAKGSGTQVVDVNRLLKQFRDMKKMMKVLAKPGSIDRLGKGMFPRI
ncbi:MAG TPA: signal recognition particle protein, partial [Candidatus Krumholzibacteria bacterium]|nr:signal recognition particle protein [Candidatus Krumholzibacteria bacterium]